MSDMFSGTPGNHVFYVAFTPNDMANYNAVRDIPVMVEVAALPPDLVLQCASKSRIECWFRSVALKLAAQKTDVEAEGGVEGHMPKLVSELGFAARKVVP